MGRRMEKKMGMQKKQMFDHAMKLKRELRRAQTEALLAIAQLLIDERSEYHRYKEGDD